MGTYFPTSRVNVRYGSLADMIVPAADVRKVGRKRTLNCAARTASRGDTRMNDQSVS
jgi:hypothetical protein